MTVPIRDDQLSPFVPALHADVSDRLQRLFGLAGQQLEWGLEPDGVRLRVGPEGRRGAFDRLWAEPGPDDVRMGITLEATDAGGRLRASFEADGGTANARIVRSALAKRFKALPERPADVASLRSALDAYRPFAGVRDEEFRRVYPSPMGAYGQLRLAYPCNQDCWFCWQDRTAAAPPIERYYGWLDEMIAAGVPSVNFTGGEPTLHPALPDLITRAREAGLTASIQSNAIRLSQPRFLQRLIDAGLGMVMVSYHSADPAISDRMTRAPGTHAKTEAGIRAVLAAGLPLTLNCVVEEANYSRLAAHARRIVEQFIEPFPDNPPIRVTYAHPTSYFGAEGPWEAHQVDYDAIRPHLVEACRTILASGVDLQLGGPCGFPVCIWNGADDLLDRDVIHRDLYEEEDLAHRRYAEVCATCALRNRCFGLREEYLKTFGERGLRPFTA